MEPYVAQDLGGFGRLLEARFRREELDAKKAEADRQKKLNDWSEKQAKKKAIRDEDDYQAEKKARRTFSDYVKKRTGNKAIANIAFLNPKMGESLMASDVKDQKAELEKVDAMAGAFKTMRQKYKESGSSIEENYDTIKGVFGRKGWEIPDQYDENWATELGLIGEIIDEDATSSKKETAATQGAMLTNKGKQIDHIRKGLSVYLAPYGGQEVQDVLTMLSSNIAGGKLSIDNIAEAKNSLNNSYAQLEKAAADGDKEAIKASRKIKSLRARLDRLLGVAETEASKSGIKGSVDDKVGADGVRTITITR